jgi:16S rRNA processing protein RimM
LAPTPVVLGRISGLFGVRGWVKVFSYTEPREAVLHYKGLLLGRNGDWQPVKVAEGQRHGKSVILRLEGFDDRDQAAQLIGTEIGANRSELTEPEDGHYYWLDLMGLKVVHRDGTELGTIKDMLETGAHDVMVVKSEQDGEQERLIPFVKDDVVISVDLNEKQVNVDWEWD